ncbi:undecaprenyl/decaprenyl-phosphate alpha-N-acetylglucosaminyl 1-phosphate transferase [Brevibacillus fluminis]|uniref:Undecaprenyl/decaprenyl-phosphate alpha-N-acetylglucosaminyl 1-phosphate transferase n=2 Tax=Brevibacillus fluminis TaxID=511487 RepID=A0A3M8CYX9_9BACL|nr:undecaprenyl/decaprenyl-phosphate alpha-N-acetylglucosaminyl 1-phosphate transferase [Brevibacillus fluminis]
MFGGVLIVSMMYAEWDSLVVAVISGGVLLVGVGAVDDWFKAQRREFPVSPRLIVQGLATIIAFALDIRFRGISTGWLGGDEGQMVLFPLWLSFIATVLWILGLTNMMNFLDGADGLAGGVTTISATTLFFIAWLTGQSQTALMAAILVGATLAFLRFNFHPAQLFMGDAGSAFLGYTLALLGLEGAMKGATLVSLTVTVLALGLPVVDTLQVMVSRLRAGLPVYKADRRHVHHRLLSKGLTTRQTVVVLYVVSFLFSLTSVCLFLFL